MKELMRKTRTSRFSKQIVPLFTELECFYSELTSCSLDPDNSNRNSQGQSPDELRADESIIHQLNTDYIENFSQFTFVEIGLHIE